MNKPSEAALKLMREFLFPTNVWPIAYSPEMNEEVEAGAILLEKFAAQARLEEAKWWVEQMAKRGEHFDLWAEESQRIAALKAILERP